jgi:hypothetical protein
MNYMVVHEQLKAGGWRTIVPDMPRCAAVTGVKFESRKHSAERNVINRASVLIKANNELPKSTTKTVRLKRTVKRCYVHFVHIDPIAKSEGEN